MLNAKLDCLLGTLFCEPGLALCRSTDILVGLLIEVSFCCESDEFDVFQLSSIFEILFQ